MSMYASVKLMNPPSAPSKEYTSPDNVSYRLLKSLALTQPIIHEDVTKNELQQMENGFLKVRVHFDALENRPKVLIAK
ncbi:hypothetical protein L596_000532 [Steinernema carpocapsae]|uniref:Uncharacterized protein n=1 Tax=Steinernema carpocapsae TaxID=34508 RepID=A0A4U8UKS1_STECR|nr:hypothetical protein L596_000532 [Steinernema carpocapsae]